MIIIIHLSFFYGKMTSVLQVQLALQTTLSNTQQSLTANAHTCRHKVLYIITDFVTDKLLTNCRNAGSEAVYYT